MAKMILQGIRVLDLERALNFYEQAFGLALTDRYDFDDFVLAYIRNDENDFELEVVLNKGRTEPYTIGDAHDALGVVVDDLEAEHRRLADLGIKPSALRELRPGGEPLARYFRVIDPDGHSIDVMERTGRWR